MGENLQGALHEAWDSEERKGLVREIKEGIRAMSDAIEKTAEDIAENPTAQRLKADVDDFAERVRSGEVSTKLREDLMGALQKINSKIETVGGESSEEGTSEDEEA